LDVAGPAEVFREANPGAFIACSTANGRQRTEGDARARRKIPDVPGGSDAIYVRDGSTYTSAGVTAVVTADPQGDRSLAHLARHLNVSTRQLTRRTARRGGSG
jgi:transcriptional regulator GlxA family with amidase domain